MEQPADTQTSPEKIYKDRAIWVGTFVGGPLAAGYLIAENFKAFNEFGNARKTWIYTIIATIVIFGGIFLIPDNVKIPNQIIPLIYTALAYYLVQHFQGQKITSYINSGGQLHSWWRTIWVGVIGLVITSIPILAFGLLGDATTNAAIDTKTYGIMKHEIAFDKNNISETEVNKIADGLTRTTFFDEDVTKYIYAKKVNNDFEISISCDRSVTSNAEALQAFAQLRTELQKLFPDNKIVFNLIVDNLDNIVKRLE